jgi:hypothetical protein
MEIETIKLVLGTVFLTILIYQGLKINLKPKRRKKDGVENVRSKEFTLDGEVTLRIEDLVYNGFLKRSKLFIYPQTDLRHEIFLLPWFNLVQSGVLKMDYAKDIYFTKEKTFGVFKNCFPVEDNKNFMEISYDYFCIDKETK